MRDEICETKQCDTRMDRSGFELCCRNEYLRYSYAQEKQSFLEVAEPITLSSLQKNTENHKGLLCFFGRNDRIRTCDILVPNQARYQLRYIPRYLINRSRCFEFIVTPLTILLYQSHLKLSSIKIVCLGGIFNIFY